MKEFAIIGLGNFGATVAKTLSQYDCNVTAIDADKNKVHALQKLVRQAIVADATELEFLQNLEVNKFDGVVVSTGENTDIAVLIVLHLKELGAKKIIVKAKSDDHAKILLKVGASQAIIPEQQVATRVAHSLAEANVVDYLPLTGGNIVAEVPPPDQVVNKTLAELQFRKKYNIQVIAVKNIATGLLEFGPSGNHRVTLSDRLVVLGKREDIESLK